jgi:hypothetical protein
MSRRALGLLAAAAGGVAALVLWAAPADAAPVSSPGPSPVPGLDPGVGAPLPLPVPLPLETPATPPPAPFVPGPVSAVVDRALGAAGDLTRATEDPLGALSPPLAPPLDRLVPVLRATSVLPALDAPVLPLGDLLDPSSPLKPIEPERSAARPRGAGGAAEHPRHDRTAPPGSRGAAADLTGGRGAGWGESGSWDTGSTGPGTLPALPASHPLVAGAARALDGPGARDHLPQLLAVLALLALTTGTRATRAHPGLEPRLSGAHVRPLARPG